MVKNEFIESNLVHSIECGDNWIALYIPKAENPGINSDFVSLMSGNCADLQKYGDSLKWIFRLPYGKCNAIGIVCLKT